MSVWSAVGGILGGAAGFLTAGPIGAALGYGLGSSVGGSVDKSNAQREANDINVQLARENNETSLQIARQNIDAQVAENAKSRSFSEQQQQREFEQQKAMWQLQTNYNSPVEQVKRLREAGLNPVLAMQGNSGMVSSQTMPNVPSAPSPSLGVSPSLPVLQQGHVEPIPSLGLSQIDAIARLAEAKKATKDADLSEAQAREVDGLFDEKLRNLKLVNDAQDMANTLQRDILPLVKDNQGKKYLAEVAVLTKQAYMYEEQGKTEESQRKVNEATAALRKAEKHVSKEQRKLFQLQVEGYPQELQASLAKLRSEVNRNNAEASLSKEQAERIRKLLPEEFKITQHNAGQSAVELVQAWEDYYNHRLTPSQRKMLREKVTEELEAAIRDNTTSWWNPVQWISTVISPLARTVGIALGGNASVSSSSSSSVKKNKNIIQIVK